MCAHSAVAPLVHDQTSTRVSSVHSAPVAGSAVPPQRSTTVRPSTVTVTDAPTSSRSAKFRSNSARTSTNRGSCVPLTVIGPSILPPGSGHIPSLGPAGSTVIGHITSQLGHFPPHDWTESALRGYTSDVLRLRRDTTFT